MNNVFNHLPIAFPFYQDVKSQEIYKENLESNLFYKLITPLDRLLPFQIEMPVGKPNPTKWEILVYDEDGSYVAFNLIPSLPLIKIYTFADRKIAVYDGQQLIKQFKAGITLPLDMSCGYYYTKITFADGSYYVSDIFYAKPNLADCIKVDFWCSKDLKPVIYRDGWKQWLYLPTFVHTASPEVEEESIKDGYNNEIPVYQKMMLKYKFIDVVPDFLKTALVSLQIQDFVYLWISETRQGYVDRVWVAVTPDDTGATSEVEVTFEDDILLKTNCGVDDNLQNVSTW